MYIYIYIYIYIYNLLYRWSLVLDREQSILMGMTILDVSKQQLDRQLDEQRDGQLVLDTVEEYLHYEE